MGSAYTLWRASCEDFPFPLGARHKSCVRKTGRHLCLSLKEGRQRNCVRETLEESGFHIAVDVATKLVTRYTFVWNGSTYDCETWWYRGVLSRDTPDAVDDEAYILSARWYPVDNVETLFAHHPVVLSSIQQMVRDV